MNQEISPAIRKQDSESIAIGRAAGNAYEAGNIANAEKLWARLPIVTGMPSLKEFREAFETNRKNFAKWEDHAHFPAGDSAFPNACGSLARVSVYASHNIKVQTGTDVIEEWAYGWGIEALRAAGLEKAAKIIESFVLPIAASPVVTAESQQPLDTGKRVER